MTAHTYKNASVTIDGKAFASEEITISGVDAKRFQPGDKLAISDSRRTYEATVTLNVPDEDELDALAWRAIATPALEASGVLDVLADALLERGTIIDVLEDREPDPNDYHGEWAGTYARVRSVREQAWDWARERAQPPLLDRIRAVLDSAATVIRPRSPIEWEVPMSFEPPRREHRGFGNAPLALRAKLKPWER